MAKGTIGANIKLLREDLELSQAQLALKVKVHQAHISKIERGEVEPGVKIIRRLCRVLKSTPNELFGIEP